MSSVYSVVSDIDHDDGKFLGTMECQWFSSRYHCSQWFFNGFFTSEPSLMMVFHISTIGINGFSNGFSIRDDGFSMVFYRGTIGIDGFFTVEPLVSMVCPMVT